MCLQLNVPLSTMKSRRFVKNPNLIDWQWAEIVLKPQNIDERWIYNWSSISLLILRYHQKESNADLKLTRKEHPYQTHHNNLNIKYPSNFIGLRTTMSWKSPSCTWMNIYIFLDTLKTIYCWIYTYSSYTIIAGCSHSDMRRVIILINDCHIYHACWGHVISRCPFFIISCHCQLIIRSCLIIQPATQCQLTWKQKWYDLIQCEFFIQNYT